MGTSAGRMLAGALALALASPWAAHAEMQARDARAVADELGAFLRDLEGAATAADIASRRWMTLRLREMELRAAAVEARNAFEGRVRSAYMTGPGRAVEMVLGASDIHDLATRLPYVSTVLAAQRLDVRALAAAHGALADVLAAAEDAQRTLIRAEERLSALRGAIEARLARARAAARDDAGALASIGAMGKRYAGTVQRVSGATRTIRHRRGEAMFAEAAPYLGPRPDCSVPKGLRSTGDRIAGEASWYGNEFRGKPTASGATFVPERYTVAHRTLPFGLYLLIRFRDRCVVAFLNDRGPYVDGRILDLSQASAQAVGLTGVQDVRATLLVRTR